MKQTFILALILSGSHLAQAKITPLAGPEPTRVAAAYSKVYVADGFDSNDLVQVTGEGMFRNTCYRQAETTVTVNEATHTILVGPVAYEYSGLCLQVILPFNRVIDVGILKEGNWTIEQGNHEKLREFSVKPATSNNADDFLYAPISQAFYSEEAGVSQVVLTGEFANDCMSLDSEKVLIQTDAIVIQPIAKVDSSRGCHDGKFSFSKVVMLPAMPPGRYLLHVRSMGGNAINSLIEVKK